ncbi:hypothetical protein [Beggiatoa leptomitoformis]|uniref:Uncharacterized protein n=1 Tax=Beggiatoa leptomitoformis TaxID=288004 RepID=A0A2N9YE78_9GAMM|nr:hypothetical protein [Beggiatoa leptomitoformis]ALG68952.1 hypothetical protein AL038_16200 [Beggiatoa leptomitoformis]AUI68659.1 hypothetical protein BLE401_08050 [Beggiatoa leptomitoformis]
MIDATLDVRSRTETSDVNANVLTSSIRQTAMAVDKANRLEAMCATQQRELDALRYTLNEMFDEETLGEIYSRFMSRLYSEVN